jgi:hypothetical protein
LNAFVYIVDGEGLFGAEAERGGDEQMARFAQDGDQVRIENPENAKATLDVLLIAGVPLKEPVARYGPFVMNTEREIRQAIEHYRMGRMGAIFKSPDRSSNSTKKEKDKNDQENRSYSSTWPVSPVPAIRPSWCCTN